MAHLTDIEIAQSTTMRPIAEIAAALGIDERYIEQYGKNKAKIDYNLLSDLANRPDGKLILVTAISPTPAGEGKTTTTVGLADGLNKIGKRAVVALCEPSLGPVFGVKGGAAGGGRAQVVPHGGHQPAFYRRFSRHRSGETTCSRRCWITISIRGTR